MRFFITSFSCLLFIGQVFAEDPASSFKWRKIEDGFEVARYALSGEQYFLKSEVILLKFDPEFFTFKNSISPEIRSNIRNLSIPYQALAGINTNFFDTSNKALGLIVKNGKQINKIHEGGKLLTGIFLTKNGKGKIIHRSDYSDEDVEMAFQAGPRLISSKKALTLKASEQSSRRSGIALNSQGEIIIFATLLRFPGASLSQIQQMLLDPRLAITDALNLDGGSSSQLYIKKNIAIEDDTIISGGDLVPAALVVIRK